MSEQLPGPLDPVRMSTDYLAGVTQFITMVSQTELGDVLRAVAETYLAGQTIFLVGNGGSAATAAHLAVDLMKNSRHPGAPPVRAISLTDNAAVVTAWSNDEGYEHVFAGQLAALAVPGDLVIGISSSGRSPNVLEAFRWARSAAVRCVGILGGSGGPARGLAHSYVLAPAPTIEQQEDIHHIIAHVIATYLRQVARERALAGTLS
ncbi:SIS domain-containing protein [Micromonospora sp. CPCC 206061]|uniref:SIS domain-containing protein n=1 Tax=Micromonospora sp. CPCC 206061 TaxID=3122410 RepID=UPI002FF3A368